MALLLECNKKFSAQPGSGGGGVGGGLGVESRGTTSVSVITWLRGLLDHRGRKHNRQNRARFLSSPAALEQKSKPTRLKSTRQSQKHLLALSLSGLFFFFFFSNTNFTDCSLSVCYPLHVGLETDCWWSFFYPPQFFSPFLVFCFFNLSTLALTIHYRLHRRALWL